MKSSFSVPCGGEFPDLAEELDDESIHRLFYPQVVAFARYVQWLIDAGSKAEVLHSFAVADRASRDGNNPVCRTPSVWHSLST